MCGIVGYIGKREAYAILIKGLERLEYRGYDSAGVALLGNNALCVYKKKGKVAELKKLAKGADTVWLATDEDREGEAISWHLFESLNLDEKKTKRIVFHEITKTAIKNSACIILL